MRIVGSFSAPVMCPVFVGRAPERDELHRLIDQSRSGQGQVALVCGEAGVGKSRLVAEAKAYATTQGFLLLQGNCFPNDIAYPYAPLLDLLRSLLVSNSATLTAAVKTLARNIFPLLPELVPDQAIPLAPLEPEQEKRRLFAVLTKFFLDFSPQSPVLLIVEDVHWSDTNSLNLLHHFARHFVSHPILLLVTYRHDEIRPELRRWLAQIDRERLAQEIRLETLSRKQVDEMLSVIFVQRQTAFDMRRFLHGEFLDTLYTLTEGNPFFVEETLSSLIAEGHIFYV